jgi:hypothetical protein
VPGSSRQPVQASVFTQYILHTPAPLKGTVLRLPAAGNQVRPVCLHSTYIVLQRHSMGQCYDCQQQATSSGQCVYTEHTSYSSATQRDSVTTASSRQPVQASVFTQNILHTPAPFRRTVLRLPAAGNQCLQSTYFILQRHSKGQCYDCQQQATRPGQCVFSQYLLHTPAPLKGTVSQLMNCVWKWYKEFSQDMCPIINKKSIRASVFFLSREVLLKTIQTKNFEYE